MQALMGWGSVPMEQGLSLWGDEGMGSKISQQSSSFPLFPCVGLGPHIATPGTLKGTELVMAQTCREW